MRAPAPGEKPADALPPKNSEPAATAPAMASAAGDRNIA
jgi:hypothetical protein